MGGKGRRPRVLIATPIAEPKLYVFDEWVRSVREQDTDLPFDVLVMDNTDLPSPGYVEWLRHWAKSQPFGPGHRVRLKRFGQDVDGRMFLNPLVKVGFAEREIWDMFARWTSYDLLLSLECDVLMPPDCIRRLYETDLPWAAAWMLSRDLADAYHPGQSRRIPLLWHSLDLETWKSFATREVRTAKDWDELITKGYLEPPTDQPFPCAVTHLGCTLIRGEVIRSVPFRLTNAGGDTTYSWDAAEAGFQPHCVPIRCQHVGPEERPNAQPPYRLQEVLS